MCRLAPKLASASHYKKEDPRMSVVASDKSFKTELV